MLRLTPTLTLTPTPTPNQAAMHATEALELHQAAMYAEPDGDE